MKKILSVFALFSACFSTSWAAPVACYGYVCDAATRYDVKVQEVALCQDSACANSYVVGSGAKTFNIASANVGAAIGSYANVDAIPVGVYTYVRAIIDRNFTITGPAINSGGNNCGAVNGTSLHILNGLNGDVVDVIGVPSNIAGISWDDPATRTKVRMIKPLPTPIAISKGGARPAVTIKFDTQQGLMCAVNASLPAPPTVNISVSQ